MPPVYHGPGGRKTDDPTPGRRLCLPCGSIDPTTESGRIDISIRRNPEAEGNLSGKYITLSFHVELGEREIDADSEILNGGVYRFIL